LHRRWLNELENGIQYLWNAIIHGGTIDNAVIGGTVPEAGTFTTLTQTTGKAAGAIPISDSNGLFTLTTSTGTGAPVRATSPTLITPALGTPSSGTLTNCTGYPAASESVSGIAELATNAEALAGTDTSRVVTPDDLKYVLDRRILQYYGVSWDENADTYARTGSTAGQPWRSHSGRCLPSGSRQNERMLAT